MNFIKIKLLVIAIIMFAASSAFAALSYDVTIDTTSLANTTGYLYFTYIPVNAAASTATVSNFTGGALASANDTVNVQDGSAVSGMLPGTVTFANTNGINDYNHAITFGNSIDFLVSFPTLTAGGQAGGSSTLALGIFQDAAGSTPLFNVNGGDYAGTAFTISLMNDGTTTTQNYGVTMNPTPIPAAAWLLGSGLVGLVGIRRRNQK